MRLLTEQEEELVFEKFVRLFSIFYQKLQEPLKRAVQIPSLLEELMTMFDQLDEENGIQSLLKANTRSNWIKTLEDIYNIPEIHYFCSDRYLVLLKRLKQE